MATIDVLNKEAEKVDTVDLNDQVFGMPTSHTAVVHEVITGYLYNQRQGTKATKNISRVRGGGRKPWRQKGTGRARVGSSRSPIWVGGARIFGLEPKECYSKVPKKKRHKALKVILSRKLKENQLTVLNELNLKQPKTREIIDVLDNLNLLDNVLFVLPEHNEIVFKSIRNIADVDCIAAAELNAYVLAKYNHIVIIASALKKIEDILL